MKPVKNYIDRNRLPLKKEVAKKANDKYKINKSSSSKTTKVKSNIPSSPRNGISSNNKTDNNKIKNVSIKILGDSMVKDLGTKIENKRGGKIAVWSSPGGGIEQVHSGLKDSNPNKVEVCWAGGNDIKETGSVRLQEKFKYLINLMKERKAHSVLIGVLPRLNSGREWSSRAIALNSWLHKMCIDSNIEFINLWDHFIHRTWLFKRDGTHLTDEGKITISNRITEICNHLLGKPFLA